MILRHSLRCWNVVSTRRLSSHYFGTCLQLNVQLEYCISHVLTTCVLAESSFCEIFVFITVAVLILWQSQYRSILLQIYCYWSVSICTREGTTRLQVNDKNKSNCRLRDHWRLGIDKLILWCRLPATLHYDIMGQTVPMISYVCHPAPTHNSTRTNPWCRRLRVRRGSAST